MITSMPPDQRPLDFASFSADLSVRRRLGSRQQAGHGSRRRTDDAAPGSRGGCGVTPDCPCLAAAKERSHHMLVCSRERTLKRHEGGGMILE